LKNWIKDAIIGAVSGILNGMFGAGGGLMAVPLIEKLLKAEPKKAHASSVAIIMPLSVISAFLYYKGEYLDFSYALKFVPLGILGAVVGGILLKKISNLWLRRIFGAVMIFSAIRMVI
jgi:uncharacterized membrane protein YfcA